ncbi:hypothetical protein [Streptomyces variegatus]
MTTQWQRSGSSMDCAAMGPGGYRPVPSVLLGVAAQAAGALQRLAQAA